MPGFLSFVSRVIFFLSTKCHAARSIRLINCNKRFFSVSFLLLAGFASNRAFSRSQKFFYDFAIVNSFKLQTPALERQNAYFNRAAERINPVIARKRWWKEKRRREIETMKKRG